ncbi:immunoglobulin-like domain-containing protein, partial [uncultured Algibacter sp.]|uniref:immunoglobulin-like domain-containing protein n=1 Tax=uncultured Algibacter sp. TaxID=298659 RepID=UPI0030EED383
TTAPVITLNGASTINLNVGGIYTEQGATAVDDLDGDITASIVIGGVTVDMNTGGTYLVTYDVSDAAGNPATQVVRTVNVIPDTTAPVITLNGASTINLNVGGVYTEQGATAVDDLDGDITASIVIGGVTVDMNTGGTYLVTYDVSDAAGNPATQVVRTVNVIPDTTAPVITLNGASTINLNVGDVYTEQGATAVDDLDGDITASIVIGGDVVNTNIANTYLVTYDVNDIAGNVATQGIRTVNVLPDATAPVITLIGASVINLNVGDIYTEFGATASDNFDGNITASIVIGGDTVNTSSAGTYNVTYNVSDATGNPATQVSRTITVSEINAGCSGGIASFPYSEGFENTLGGWTQSSSDDIDWTVDASGTPSSNTGPSSAVEGNYYVFVEASTPNYPSRRAILNSPCFDLSGLTEATFSFNYHMYGAADMGSIDLELSQDEGLTWTSIWNETGNKGNSWQTAVIDLSAYTGGGIQLRFNRFVGSTWQADIAIDNISLIEGELVINSCSGEITSYPYAESFENTIGLWTQSSADDINWTIDANGTPSGSTGPSSAVQGSYYIFVEASGNGTGYPNKQAIINSPCYDLSTSTSATFSFNYHMYGAADMGTITLEASNDNGISWTPIWSESGNKGNNWLSTNIDLSVYTGNTVQLRFNRITGSTWQADIAIDNINLTIAVAAAKNESKGDLLNVSTNSFNILTLYPNPVGDILNIKTSKGENMSYRIINSLGQIVNIGRTSKAITVDNLEAGMYYIEVNDGTYKMMERFIKE